MRYFEPLNVLHSPILIQSSRSKHSNATLIEAVWILTGSDSQINGEQKLRARRVQIHRQGKLADARLSGSSAKRKKHKYTKYLVQNTTKDAK